MFSPPSPRHTLRLGAIAALLLASAELAAQTGAGSAPADRVPLHAGNWWVLAAAAGEQIEIRATEESTTREGARIVRVDDSQGDYRVFSLAADGLSLLEVHPMGRAPALFEPALAVLPLGARPGESFEQEVVLRAFDPSGDSEPQKGRALLRLRLLALEPVRTPAGLFADCLPVDGTLELSWGDGAEHTQSFRVWLAPGVGPVRLTGGGTDFRLVEARVGERALPAEP